MKNTTIILASIFYVGMLIVNTLANVLPINGLDTGEVSALYPSLFTPAGLTFSIWTVIYALLACFLVMAWRHRHHALMAAIMPWFIASCAINMAWIYVWHHLLVGLSVALMLLLLGVLTRIFFLLRAAAPSGKADRFFVHVPFIIYLAWICVATIANISAWLVAQQWNGGGLSPEVWTIVMMVVAAGLAFYIGMRYQAAVFELVVMWALLGIYLRWRTSDYQMLAYGSALLVLLLGAGFIVSFRRKRRLA